MIIVFGASVLVAPPFVEIIIQHLSHPKERCKVWLTADFASSPYLILVGHAGNPTKKEWHLDRSQWFLCRRFLKLAQALSAAILSCFWVYTCTLNYLQFNSNYP